MFVLIKTVIFFFVSFLHSGTSLFVLKGLQCLEIKIAGFFYVDRWCLDSNERETNQ